MMTVFTGKELELIGGPKYVEVLFDKDAKQVTVLPSKRMEMPGISHKVGARFTKYQKHNQRVTVGAAVRKKLNWPSFGLEQIKPVPALTSSDQLVFEYPAMENLVKKRTPIDFGSMVRLPNGRVVNKKDVPEYRPKPDVELKDEPAANGVDFSLVKEALGIIREAQREAPDLLRIELDVDGLVRGYVTESI